MRTFGRSSRKWISLAREITSKRHLSPLPIRTQEARESCREKIEELRTAILVSGEVDLTASEETDKSATDGGFSEKLASEPLQDMTEEMERRLRMSSAIERRYRRIVERRKADPGSVPVSCVPVGEDLTRESAEELKQMQKSVMVGRTDMDAIGPKRQSTTDVKPRKSEADIPESLELDVPAGEGENKEKDRELRDVLMSSEKRFFDELVSDYVKQMHVMRGGHRSRRCSRR